jgi:hypothetical protein
VTKDLTVTGFEDRPGINAAIGAALGRVGINIEGTFGSGKFGESTSSWRTSRRHDAKGADEERPPRRRQALDEGGPLTPFGGTASSCFNGRGRPSARPRL